ncbi:hypothetical protein [Leptospira bandrabouensis]|uniref:Lipoprotein n=1 Tax=Leptospira bandrabouensis TaxID=2484903 RepID=A0A6H3NN82_9LEPT|nr:hypothetical protein [Leptospira bandrabouensis]MCG6142957.1 hypothetical protein [Leptospira bandrabouensis]MCG6152011.1 hypothetical protein [Leptospira bandrabouensis]MCG6158616.1 hypothetical protein [Leptospira bandrabouensis]MCG6162552.1 hypothetical protein [Leptospira bandrabouensis]TGN09635.1 hypothetical protein EHR07_01370 [Leptospira bandrabouensis]
MNKFRITGIILLSLFSFVTACKSSVYRLESPKSKEEIKSVGLVGYGIYLEYPPGLLGTENQYQFGQTFGDHIVKLDANSQENAKKRIPDPADVLVEETEKEKIYNGKKLQVISYISRVVPVDGNSYTVSTAGYVFCRTTIVFVNGIPTSQQKCDNVYIDFDPEDTAKVMNFKAKPGEIQYLGLFKGVIKETTSEDPFALSATLDELIGMSKKKKFVLEKDNGYILNSKSELLKDRYYYPDLRRPGFDEFVFLEGVSKANPNSYWKEVADKKLSKFKK